MAKNLALIALSITLGLLFVTIGLIKLTPAINADMHKEMKAMFKKARTVFPFYKQLGWRPKTSEYRRAVGTIELVCGLILMLVPGKLKVLANIILLVMMGGAVYTHHALGDDIKHYTGALIFGLLLTCRLVIHMQTSARPADDVRQKQD